MASPRKNRHPKSHKQRINPHILTIIERDGQYMLCARDEPIVTPGGLPVAHTSIRLLHHIRRELAAHRTLDATRFGAYSIYATQREFIERGEDPILKNFDHMLLHDPLLNRSAGPEQLDQLYYWYFVLDFLEAGDCALPALPYRSCEDIDIAGEGTDAGFRENFHKVTELVRREYVALSSEQRTLIINLYNIHEAGVLLPLMLITGHCSGEEYGEALLAAHADHPAAWEAHWAEYGRNLRALREDAYTALEYIAHYYDESQNRVRRLIAAGESLTVEFKSTLRMNLDSQQKDHEIEHTALKTIAAFLNTDGGTLLIGVDDHGHIVGLEADGFDNRDRFERHFTTIVRDRLGVKATEALRTSFERLENRDVFAINVQRSSEPVFLRKGKDEEFYVRTGPQTVRLGVREAMEYAEEHFR